MQFKTTERCHLTLVRMATMKKSANNSFGEGVENRSPPHSGQELINKLVQLPGELLKD